MLPSDTEGLLLALHRAADCLAAAVPSLPSGRVVARSIGTVLAQDVGQADGRYASAAPALRRAGRDRMISGEGPRPRGRLAAILPCLRHRGPRLGYLLQFGGFGNRASRLIRNGEMIAATVNRKATVTAERKYHVLAENRGGAIRLGVDGEEIFRLQDGSPLKGSLHSRVGFYTWGCTLRIEKLTVYTEQAK